MTKVLCTNPSVFGFSRTHEGPFDAMSLATGLPAAPADEVSFTRQEDAIDTDVNVLLRRYGAVPPGREVNFGEYDFDIDLLEAMHTVRDAKAAYEGLPLTADARRSYPTWQDFVLGVQRGEVKFEKAAEAASVSPKTPEAASPSPKGAAGS